MELGFQQQGVELPLLVHALDADGDPDLPQDNPVASVYAPDGTLAARVRLGCDQQGVVTGLFRRPLMLDGRFAATGLYAVSYSWQDSSGRACGETAQFLLRPGGHADGAVIGLRAVRRPQAVFLLRQTDAGVLARGKNPR